MAGIEVEGIEIQGQGLDKVIVAKILKSESHPNADRLSVCHVDTGSGIKQIVCGAKNYKEGDHVPLALSGAKLPNGMEIKRSRLRGVESDGMMCSPKELGISGETQGLMILSSDAPLGRPIAEVLGLNDVIFDLEITPNRPDLLSHWGIAREIAALANLSMPVRHKLLSEEREKQLTASEISTGGWNVVMGSEKCLRYTARIIRGVKVGPSPEWLRRRIESLGHRSISNVVDVTNYVLHEIGQPLHAFDLNLLQGDLITARFAKTGEKLVCLDEVTRELKEDMVVIADAKRAIALAGIIGGSETAVSETTRDILLESATFHAPNIRKTSKALQISTDSSYRFERGVDIELAAWANNRAAALMVDVCGGKVEGPLIDRRSRPPLSRRISCRYSQLRSLTGTMIPPEEVHAILRRLDCKVNHSQQHAGPEEGSKTQWDGGSCEVEPPSNRQDLDREVDLIEEVVRVYGIDRISGALVPVPLSTTKDHYEFLLSRQLRQIATSLGLDEIQTYPLVSLAHLQTARFPNLEGLILANPLTSEMNALRPSMVYGLMEVASRNLAGGNSGVALFELGQIFEVKEGRVEERLALGILLAGFDESGATWERGMKGKTFDLFDLKGVMNGFLEQLGLQNVSRWEPGEEVLPVLEKELNWRLISREMGLGSGGEVKTALVKTMKIPTHVFYAELDVKTLANLPKKIVRYEPWTVYPVVRRDMALTVKKEQKHQEIEEVLNGLAKKIAEPKGIFLQKIELFDIFESEKIGSGNRSLAYSMQYRSSVKTLTDAEVNEVHDSIKEALRTRVSCDVRD